MADDNAANSVKKEETAEENGNFNNDPPNGKPQTGGNKRGGNNKDGVDVCRDYLNGICARGNRCRFRHPPDEGGKEQGIVPYTFCIDFQVSFERCITVFKDHYVYF